MSQGKASENIAGYKWWRLRDETFDIQLTTVVDDEGHMALWCIGCFLTGSRECFLHLDEVRDHIIDHGHPGQR